MQAEDEKVEIYDVSGALKPLDKEEALQKHETAFEKAAEAKKRARLQQRIDELAAVATSYPVELLQQMTDEEYESLLANATELHDEKVRLQEEEKKAQQAELEALRAKQEADQAELEALRRAKAIEQNEDDKFREQLEEESRNNQAAFREEVRGGHGPNGTYVPPTPALKTFGARQDADTLVAIANVMGSYRVAKHMTPQTPAANEAIAWMYEELQRISEELKRRAAQL